MSKNISIVIPVYNEESNIKNIYQEITSRLNDYKYYELIFIEDGSNDNTYINLLELKKREKNLIIIKNESNFGQSYSIHKGIRESNFENIITIDGDGQNDPKDITMLIDLYFKNPNTKLIAGIRNKRRDNLIKIFSSKIANSFRNMILKDGCKDTGCSLKIFDKKTFLKFPYFNGIHRFLPALFKGYGCKVKYVDVNHRSRISGVSKYGTFMRFFRGIRDLIKVIIILNKKNIK